MNMTPNGSSFRTVCGAAIAYGIVSGGAKADTITLEPLGKRILTPTKEGDDFAAKREAIVKPRVVGEFLQRYANAPLPRHDIALNVLVELGVPRDRVEAVYKLIVDSAQGVGFIRDIKGKQYVDLTGTVMKASAAPEAELDDTQESLGQSDDMIASKQAAVMLPASAATVADNRRVFITHGKNKAFIEPVKRLLGFGEMAPIVSVEQQSVSKPVPDKVMDDLRSCGAAIIHVDSEQVLFDKEAHEHVVINPNVLIEIGAAMALYGRRFILLVKEGVQLPSNLQGLFEVRYSGDTLDGDATIRLLEAINALKSTPPPARYTAG
jgi:predicted nucleotide-binding protein